MKTTKQRLLKSINTVIPLKDYDSEDCIFGSKYGISSVNMVYILLDLAKEFNFKITDNFVDSLEMCSFLQLESILEKYENT